MPKGPGEGMPSMLWRPLSAMVGGDRKGGICQADAKFAGQGLSSLSSLKRRSRETAQDYGAKVLLFSRESSFIDAALL